MVQDFPWQVSADRSGLVFERAAGFLADYIMQLEEEDYISRGVLPWERLYALLEDESHEDSLYLLKLPPIFNARPELMSRGALNDSEFSIVLTNWIMPDGKSIAPALLVRKGAVAKLRGEPYLLTSQQYILLDAVAEFHRRPQKDFGFQQREWAKIRKYAIDAEAKLDRFLSQTIVLRPESLHFELNKGNGEDGYAGELVPSFEDMPAGWLDAFDKIGSVQDSYSIPEANGGIVHILVDEAVSETLKKVKKLPGKRKLTRNDLIALKSNPHGFLGDASQEIVSLDEIDRKIDEAGFILWEHVLNVYLGNDRKIHQAEMRLTPMSDVAKYQEIMFEVDIPRQLKVYCDSALQAFDSRMPEFMWEGYILRTQDAERKVVEEILASLNSGTRVIHDDSIWQDISQYGDRVQGIGELIKIPSQFLMKSSKINWAGDDNSSTGVSGDANLDGDGDNYKELPFGKDAENGGDTGAVDGDTRSGEDVPDITGSEGGLLSDEGGQTGSGIGNGEDDSDAGQSRSGMEVLQPGSNIDGDDYSRTFEKKGEDLSSPKLPQCLKDGIKLLPHQEKGVAWLQKLVLEKASGCILADDMGLGKTLQLLSFIVRYFEDTPADERLPVLVVAPVSLMENWGNEVEHFFSRAPMSLQLMHGDALQRMRIREGNHNSLQVGWRTGDVVLTTYDTLRSFQFPFAREKWHCLICDEAQRIKNPNAMVTQAIKAVGAQSEFCIACTGTPVENSLSDLWCLFDFSCPGYLGSLNHDFGPTYQRPIELQQEGYEQKNIELKKKISPYVLRRLKSSVAKDLPKKIEDSPEIKMSADQLAMCRNAIMEYRATLEDYKRRNIRKNPALFLLHKLRRICADPYPEETDVQTILQKSPKMQWLKDKLIEIKARREKAIVFSEFRTVQRSVKKMLSDCFGLNPFIINGDTDTVAGLNSRQGLINQFQETDGFNVIILSTTAVGFGVNVQEANHVIHFTRSWNPAKEDQATDRAYRIGQKRDVYVYYPTMLDEEPHVSFESNLNRLLAGKRELARDILATGKELRAEDFMDSMK